MRKIILALIVFVAVSGDVCSAEVKTFHAESSYLMSSSEPIFDAQDKVFKDAVRMISEEAGVIVESLSKSRNGWLELDRMETLTAAVLRVKSKTFGKEFTVFMHFAAVDGIACFYIIDPVLVYGYIILCFGYIYRRFRLHEAQK